MHWFSRHPHHHFSALCLCVGNQQVCAGGILSKGSQRPSGDPASQNHQTATIVVKVNQFLNFCFGWGVVLSTASSPLHSKLLKRASYFWILQRKLKFIRPSGVPKAMTTKQHPQNYGFKCDTRWKCKLAPCCMQLQWLRSMLLLRTPKFTKSLIYTKNAVSREMCSSFPNYINFPQIKEALGGYYTTIRHAKYGKSYQFNT